MSPEILLNGIKANDLSAVNKELAKLPKAMETKETKPLSATQPQLDETFLQVVVSQSFQIQAEKSTQLYIIYALLDAKAKIPVFFLRNVSSMILNDSPTDNKKLEGFVKIVLARLEILEQKALFFIDVCILMGVDIAFEVFFHNQSNVSLLFTSYQPFWGEQLEIPMQYLIQKHPDKIKALVEKYIPLKYSPPQCMPIDDPCILMQALNANPNPAVIHFLLKNGIGSHLNTGIANRFKDTIFSKNYHCYAVKLSSLQHQCSEQAKVLLDTLEILLFHGFALTYTKYTYGNSSVEFEHLSSSCAVVKFPSDRIGFYLQAIMRDITVEDYSLYHHFLAHIELIEKGERAKGWFSADDIAKVKNIALIRQGHKAPCAETAMNVYSKLNNPLEFWNQVANKTHYQPIFKKFKTNDAKDESLLKIESVNLTDLQYNLRQLRCPIPVASDRDEKETLSTFTGGAATALTQSGFIAVLNACNNTGINSSYASPGIQVVQYENTEKTNNDPKPMALIQIFKALENHAIPKVLWELILGYMVSIVVTVQSGMSCFDFFLDEKINFEKVDDFYQLRNFHQPNAALLKQSMFPAESHAEYDDTEVYNVAITDYIVANLATIGYTI